MIRRHDLGPLAWSVSGWTPWQWALGRSMELGQTQDASILPVPAPVPGSVQQALLSAGLIPDPYHGLDAAASEWVENRHWVYETTLSAALTGGCSHLRLVCLGLDYAGKVLVNGAEIGEFRGTFTPHAFDLAPHVKPGDNRLQIVFTDIPRWLGQFGHTSRMTEWKTRYNYTWDWTSRVVQIGIWDAITLEAGDGARLDAVRAWTTEGGVRVVGEAHGGDTVRVEIAGRSADFPAAQLSGGVALDGLDVARWFPNGVGAQPLYPLTVTLRDAGGAELDRWERRVGFRTVDWRPCDGAPADADPWICAVNDVPIFLQGVNWTPIRPLFADLTDDDYRTRLEAYRDLGMNCLRVWGGAFLEKPIFYDLCDELGLLVWQEMPLSSSGIDNWPPEDTASIAAHEAIARSYAARRQHHASLLMWSGGNELQGDLDGNKTGTGKPCDLSHPLLAAHARVLAEVDPTRRFVATSSSGPRFSAAEADFGKGLHWDTHGPWRADGDLATGWTRYWQGDDSLFRSETGHPGASPVDVIRGYAGGLDPFPPVHANALWRRTPWWIEDAAFAAENGRPPETLEEYVAWSQARQASALAIAAGACRERFPRCGGFLVWMGHDCFPCATNTAILDFHGRPKPAAHALAEVFRKPLP